MKEREGRTGAGGSEGGSRKSQTKEGGAQKRGRKDQSKREPERGGRLRPPLRQGLAGFLLKGRAGVEAYKNHDKPQPERPKRPPKQKGATPPPIKKTSP